MQMGYKISLGAINVKRIGFLKFVEMFRNNSFSLNCDSVTLSEIIQINQLTEYLKSLATIEKN
jgi:hypothetical protein